MECTAITLVVTLIMKPWAFKGELIKSVKEGSVGIRLGVEFCQKFTFSIGYDFGLVNVWNKNWGESDIDVDDYDEVYLVDDVKNRNLTITLGYKF